MRQCYQNIRQIYLNYKLRNACVFGNKDKIKGLLDKGADINAADKNGITPLFIACLNNHLDLAKFLVSKGADIHAIECEYRQNLLHAACFANRIEVAKWLVEDQNMDINAANNLGDAPLHLACHYGYVELAYILIKLGADKELQNNVNKKPEDYLEQERKTELANLMEVKTVDQASSSTDWQVHIIRANRSRLQAEDRGVVVGGTP